MKYIYVIAERNPYRAYVKKAVSESESDVVVCAFTGNKILELMGDTAVLKAVYEVLIQNGELKLGDILGPERP